MAVAPQPKRATVNETLRDRGIAHAVFLERQKVAVAARVVEVLRDEVIPDLVAQLTARIVRIEDRGFDLDPKATKRLQETLELMEETVEAWTSGLAGELAEESTNIAAAEVKWQDDLFHQVVPIAWDTIVPATSILAAVVAESPIDGVLLADIVGRMESSVKVALEKAIRIGIAEGEAIDKITARVREATGFMESSAEAVARTAVGHASNMGRTQYYSDNGDIIKAVQWVATLDTRTCASCQALDGKTFAVDKGARPPRHINCRCTTVPVLKSLRELGFNLDDLPPSTRASMNGQVAGTLTYNQWLKRMPPSIQDEALGPTRGNLFRTGELDVQDFVSRTGDPYTLDELHKREKSAWAKAGL